jgi:phage tail-like protein
MSFNNQQYLYEHLPARFRREDKELFLKRFLQFTGETLDKWDATFDAFFENIESGSADEIWIDFWLQQLFGWSWYPWWFTIAEKRRLYGNFARHLARRGTRRGIELWLLDFGIVARVHTRSQPWGEFVWGDTHFAIDQPLHLIVEILFLQSGQTDLSVWGEGVWTDYQNPDLYGDILYADGEVSAGEGFYSNPKPLLSEADIIRLIRYVQPHSQEIVIVWRQGIQYFPLPPAESPLYSEPLYGD